MNPTLLIVSSLLIAIAGNAILGQAAWHKQQDLKVQQATAQAELDRTRLQAARLPQLRQDVLVARKDLANLNREFPVQENLGILIQNLQDAAASSGLTVSAINRQVTPSPIPGFDQVNLNVLAAGKYPATVQFLGWAKNQKRLLNVTSLNSTSDATQTLAVTAYVHHTLSGGQ